MHYRLNSVDMLMHSRRGREYYTEIREGDKVTILQELTNNLVIDATVKELYYYRDSSRQYFIAETKEGKLIHVDNNDKLLNVKRRRCKKQIKKTATELYLSSRYWGP